MVIITGVAASACTSLSLLPQVIKTIRTHKVEDVSYLMLAALFAGGILWIIYGVLKDDWIIIASNSISILISFVSSYFSIKYRPKDKNLKELV